MPEVASWILEWRRLANLEPLLFDLEHLMRTLIVSEDDPRYWPHYEQWKRQLQALVGWGSMKPALQGSENYDICHTYLLATYERGTPA